MAQTQDESQDNLKTLVEAHVRHNLPNGLGNSPQGEEITHSTINGFTNCQLLQAISDALQAASIDDDSIEFNS